MSNCQMFTSLQNGRFSPAWTAISLLLRLCACSGLISLAACTANFDENLLTPTGDAGVILPTPIPGSSASSSSGSAGSSSTSSSSGAMARFHPQGYAAGNVHGPEMKQQAQDCRGCHAQDLTGAGAATSCDLCHTPAQPMAWRSDCTFCHGGVESSTGAPPINIDDSSGPSRNGFVSHNAHVQANIAADMSCTQCHTGVTDVLSIGHVFDNTPGVAEVGMGDGLSPQGEFAANVGCGNAYCHGDGRGDNGSVALNAGAMNCASCHASIGQAAAQWSEMSGFHSLHLSLNDVDCGECHQQVTRDGLIIDNVNLHVNGDRNVSFLAPGFTFAAAEQTCAGTCHGKAHNNLPWGGAVGGGEPTRFHPANYALSSMHGVDMELQRLDCRGCHAADLTGNGNATSCDACHNPADPQAWRSDCTFCHGGTDNNTGAPPRDLGGAESGLTSFNAHTAHVTDGIAAAYDCVQCHTKPGDVLDVNHAFDGTAGAAELNFSAGLSDATTYANKTCSNSYCHGNGRADNGVVADGAVMLCSSCHAAVDSGAAAWGNMSSFHSLHLTRNITCANCHQDTTDNSTAILNPTLHVDGLNQVKFSENTITYDANNKQCAGPCHGRNHNFRW